MIYADKKIYIELFFLAKYAECEKSQDIWYYGSCGCFCVWILSHFTPSLCAILAVVCDLWVCNPCMLFVGTHYLPPETRGRQPLHGPAPGNTLLEGGATENRKYQHGQ